MTSSSTVVVPPERIERWMENFTGRHGTTDLAVVGGALHGAAADGSHFDAALPFGVDYAGPATASGFAEALLAAVPDDWGVLLVRKGGFAVARLAGLTTTASKTGQRHVQGRTKAGGQSQQRFARRRDNQARQAYEAAAEHAARVLDGLAARGGPVVTGGDHGAVEEVLADPRLAGLRGSTPWLALPDPRRAVLEQGVDDAVSAAVRVVNA